MRNIIRSVLFLSILFCGITAAQTKTNLELFYSLIDSSIAQLPAEIPAGNTVLLYTGNNSLLYNYIFQKLDSKFGGISAADSGLSLSYALKRMDLKYGDIFRKKFLGDYYIERNMTVAGNFVIPSEGIGRDFNYAYSDTVQLDSIRGLESALHPFTRGDIPSEPFLPGIIEPVIAIGTAATAVVLFFILRSK